jgi:hypothetical protein
MLFHKTKILISGLVMLSSATAQAAAVQFQESFSGYITVTNELDTFYYEGQSTFDNGFAVLSTSYEVIRSFPDIYTVFGSFTRTDHERSISGVFDFSLTTPDLVFVPDPSMQPILGNLTYDNTIFSPITGDPLVPDVGFGLLRGFVTEQNYVFFGIDWYMLRPDSVSSVPAPATTNLFGVGLMTLALLSLIRRKFIRV